jgi:hypothetical protein
MPQPQDSHLAYPLHWPNGHPRTPPGQRRRGAFRTPLGRARDDVVEEITARKRLGGQNPVVSTNLSLRRRDGLPYANQAAPEDPGVAVYWEMDGQPYAMACDRWLSVADNLQAISKTLRALRGIQRWGPTEMVHRAFRGFQALPTPEDAGGTSWRQVLGTQTLSLEVAEHVARGLLHRYHPDRETGDRQRYQLVLWARDQARRELDREAAQ